MLGVWSDGIFLWYVWCVGWVWGMVRTTIAVHNCTEMYHKWLWSTWHCGMCALYLCQFGFLFSQVIIWLLIPGESNENGTDQAMKTQPQFCFKLWSNKCNIYCPTTTKKEFTYFVLPWRDCWVDIIDIRVRLLIGMACLPCFGWVVMSLPAT